MMWLIRQWSCIGDELAWPVIKVYVDHRVFSSRKVQRVQLINRLPGVVMTTRKIKQEKKLSIWMESEPGLRRREVDTGSS